MYSNHWAANIRNRTHGSQTPDSMDWWSNAGGKRQRRERKPQRRSEKRNNQKKEHQGALKGWKVARRNTVFFKCFVAPEGRKVGLLKRRVRSHLAISVMKDCTQSKCKKHRVWGIRPAKVCEASKLQSLLGASRLKASKPQSCKASLAPHASKPQSCKASLALHASKPQSCKARGNWHENADFDEIQINLSVFPYKSSRSYGKN